MGEYTRRTTTITTVKLKVEKLCQLAGFIVTVDFEDRTGPNLLDGYAPNLSFYRRA
jgi:hypothetical protein